MKRLYLNIEQPYQRFCRGSESVGLLGSGAMGMMSSMYSTGVSAQQNRKQREWSSEEAQKQRDWASAEWDKQFDMQSKEWYKQQDYGNQQAYDYWLKQQEYNSPQNMVSRAAAAGFNPSAALNAQQFGGTGLSAAPTSTPSPSVPAGAHAQSSPLPVSSPSNLSQSFGEMANGIGNLVSGLASASKNNAEAKQITSTLSTYIQQQVETLEGQKLMNTWQKYQNEFFEITKDKRVQQVAEDLNKTINEARYWSEKADLTNFEKATEQARKILIENQGKLNEKQWQIAENFLTVSLPYFKAKINQANASAADSYAGAGLKRAQTETEDEFREDRKEEIRVNIRGKYQEIKLDRLREKLLDGEVKVSDLELTSAQLKEARERKLLDARDNPVLRNIDEFMYFLSSHFGIAFGGSASIISPRPGSSK